MDFAMWSDNLSIDIELIDSQHKILIGLINDTSRLIIENRDSEVRKVINELRNYTETHFSEEEELFLRSDYPKSENHLKEHGIFVEKLSEFEKNLHISEASVSLNILEFLKNWLFYHIEIVDKGYALYVKKELKEY